MNKHLKSKICQSFNLSTLISEEPPPTLRSRINFLREIFILCPPPEEPKAYLLSNYPKNPEWIELNEAMLVGNSSETQLRLQDPTVSRKHCLIEKCNEWWVLKDLGSANGVYVNGDKIVEKRLNHGDVIQTGVSMLVFIDNNIE